MFGSDTAFKQQRLPACRPIFTPLAVRSRLAVLEARRSSEFAPSPPARLGGPHFPLCGRAFRHNRPDGSHRFGRGGSGCDLCPPPPPSVKYGAFAVLTFTATPAQITEVDVEYDGGAHNHACQIFSSGAGTQCSVSMTAPKAMQAPVYVYYQVCTWADPNSACSQR